MTLSAYQSSDEPRVELEPRTAITAASASKPPLHLTTVSVPRQYGLGTTLIVTILTALLFGALRFLDSEPVVYLISAGFFTALAFAQWYVGEGNSVRRASIVVGLVFAWVTLFAVWVYFDERGMTWLLWRRWWGAVAWIFLATVAGAFFGYLGGALIAGIFLVMRLADEWFISPADELANASASVPGDVSSGSH